MNRLARRDRQGGVAVLAALALADGDLMPAEVFIPFILEACDYTFEYGEVRRANLEFKLKPSEYFARRVYGCYIFEEHAPRELVDSIG